MFENVDGQTTDGRTDDGRTTDARVTGILIAHLGAFGSGELKSQSQLQYTTNFIIWASSGENLFSGFLTKKDSNQSSQVTETS